jgi:CrcB protein
MAVLIAVFVAGGLGALTRYAVDAAVVSRWQRRTTGTWVDFPAGTFLINVSGAGLLGVLTGYATAHGGPVPDHLLTIAGTGYLGAYTTFSTEEWQTLGLLRSGRGVVAVSVVGSLAASLLLAGLGLWLGARL